MIIVSSSTEYIIPDFIEFVTVQGLAGLEKTDGVD